jgi:pimeloyl-ACP methyl ester carboxylesterase
MVRAAQEHDAGPLLSEIRAPTLVVAGERDLFTPRKLSLEMAQRIPSAELLEIPRGSHAALIEQPELINLRLEKFLRERVIPFESQREDRPRLRVQRS